MGHRYFGRVQTTASIDNWGFKTPSVLANLRQSGSRKPCHWRAGFVVRACTSYDELEVVQEAIAYCQTNPPELGADYRKDEVLAQAIGMNDPAVQRSGWPRSLSTEERVRLGL
jgi:hypothetical protein